MEFIKHKSTNNKSETRSVFVEALDGGSVLDHII